MCRFFELGEWVGEGRLCCLFPRAFRLMSNKDVVKDCYVWVGSGLSSRVLFGGVRCQSELVEYQSLFKSSFQCVHLQAMR